MKQCPPHCGRCCHNVPLPQRLLDKQKKKIVSPILRTMEMGDGNVLPFTDEALERNRCPFLTYECRCAIYEKRPEICRLFGSGQKKNILLYCKYLDQ